MVAVGNRMIREAWSAGFLKFLKCRIDNYEYETILSHFLNHMCGQNKVLGDNHEAMIIISNFLETTLRFLSCNKLIPSNNIITNPYHG